MKYITFFLLLISSCIYAQINGKVIKIKDGDTIVVLDESNESITIRLADIDCPEKGQPFSNVAKRFVQNQIGGKYVKVEKKNIDKYGRVVGYVLYDKNKNLSLELLKIGLAWHYKYFSKDQLMAKLEEQARKQKIGLWSQADPINPYHFRKNHNN